MVPAIYYPWPNSMVTNNFKFFRRPDAGLFVTQDLLGSGEGETDFPAISRTKCHSETGELTFESSLPEAARALIS